MSQYFAKPEEPKEEDCCHSGCKNCVFDVYRSDLEKWLQKVYSKRSENERTDLLSKTQFRPFSLVSIMKVAESIRLLKFRPYIEGSPSEILGMLPYDIGQHFIVRCYSNEELNTVSTVTDNSVFNKQVTRAYSIISDSRHQENCCFEVVIKLYPSGIMSKYINSLNIGDLTYWRGPYGDFKYSPNDFQNILMLCMGTGFAPLFSIIRHIVSNDEDFTIIKLVMGIKYINDIILRDELCHLGSYWNFKFVYYITGEYETRLKRHCEIFKKGRIGLESISIEMDKEKLKNSLVLISGSDSFSNDMVQHLKCLNVLDNNIFVF